MASCIAHQEKNLKGEVFLSQIQVRLENESMAKPFEGQGFRYAGLRVMHPVHG